MDYATFGLLAITGLTACPKWGLYAFVHPVLCDLPGKYHTKVERGLLRTFGRIMPELMMPCLIGSVACAMYYFDESQAQLRALWAAATFLIAALTFTIFSLEANSKQVGEISGRKIMALASWVRIPLRNSFARRLSCRLHRELMRNGIDAVPRDQTHPKSKRSYFHEPTQLVPPQKIQL